MKLFNRKQTEFLRRYVTMDEECPHHFTPESNRQSSEWTFWLILRLKTNCIKMVLKTTGHTTAIIVFNNKIKIQ